MDWFENMRRDEIGRRLTSYSAVRQFRTCQRQYKWGSLIRIEPLALVAADPRQFGKGVHAGIEAIRKGKDPDQALMRFWGDVSNHDTWQECERSRAAINGWKRRWLEDPRQADQHCEIVLCETKFSSDVINPESGEVHPSWAIRGIVDGALRVHEPCLWGVTPIEPGLYLNENKTASRIDGNYLIRLWTDFQILLYADKISEALEEPIAGVLYDVIGKPKVEHKRGETPAEFEERRAELTEKAQAGELKGRLRQRKDEAPEDFRARCIAQGMETVEALEPVEAELPEDFVDRLDQAYDAETAYHREVVPIDPAMVSDVLSDLWDTLLQIDEAADRGRWAKNEGACFKFNRACDFWQICQSLDNPTTIEENYRLRD